MPFTTFDSNTKIFTFGLMVLLVGLVFYMFLRSAKSVYFLPTPLSLYDNHSRNLGLIVNSLPSLLHVLAYSLMTATVLKTNRRSMRWICIFWVGLNILFELAQYSPDREVVSQWIPAWFQRVPVLENSYSFLANGTFGLMDWILTVIGGLVAYFIWVKFNGTSVTSELNKI